MQKKKSFLILLAVLTLVGFGCSRAVEQKTSSPEINREQILSEAKQNGLIMNDQEIVQMADVLNLQIVQGTHPTTSAFFLAKDRSGWLSAALADVTAGGSFGLAHATKEDGMYTLVASMGNLPKLGTERTYHGWIVKRGEKMQVVDVGEAILVGDRYVNIFQSATDLLDHDFYVFTLEPRDDNPAPAEHILEGMFR